MRLKWAIISPVKLERAESFSADWSSHFSQVISVGLTEDSLKRVLKIKKILHSIPEIKQDHPLNLSISVSGGKETN